MSDSESSITLGRVLRLTWPMILSNIATPLLGLVDTAVIGNLGTKVELGAIALGSVIFSFLFWTFGFLRMGTTGMTAQALGGKNHQEVRATLLRALLLAGGIGLIIVVAQLPFAWIAFRLLGGSAEVESSALLYFHIRIWGAPFALSVFVLLGWFIGLQRTRTALILQVILNGTNILLDVAFVAGLRMGVAGVALGTALSNVVAVVAGIYIARKELYRLTGSARLFNIDKALILNRERLMHTFRVNRDIMIRTIMLVFGFTWFTNEGAQMGDTILAANTVLMQFISFAAFFLDGIAFTAETLVGEAVGRGRRGELARAVKVTTLSAAVVAGCLTLLYAFAGRPIIFALTDIDAVRDASLVYLPYAILTPIVGFWCWQLDGIFIGATWTGAMRDAAILSIIAFMAAWYPLANWYQNHGLWISFMCYFIARAFFLAVYYPALSKRVSNQ